MYYYFTKSSIGTPNALAILATVWTLGLITTSLSILVRVVCLTPDFLTKSSWVKPSLFRAFLIFSPIVAIVSILLYHYLCYTDYNTMIAKLFLSFKKSPLLALLNSKLLEIFPKNGWRARVLARRSFSEVGAGEPMTSFPNWRKWWDSNPLCLATHSLSRTAV